MFDIQSFLDNDQATVKYESRQLISPEGSVVNVIHYNPNLPPEQQYTPPEGYRLSGPIVEVE